jgi:hypothetical protein
MEENHGGSVHNGQLVQSGQPDLETTNETRKVDIEHRMRAQVGKI